jgi:hypothetical protein
LVPALELPHASRHVKRRHRRVGQRDGDKHAVQLLQPHFIIVTSPSAFTSLIAAFSAAIDPKSSEQRTVIAFTASPAWLACTIEM